MDPLPTLAPNSDLPTACFDPAAPFTPAMAARAGLGRSALERLVREERVMRLIRGVYVDAGVDLDPDARARALSLAISNRHLVVGRTAAWIHTGVTLRARTDAPIPLDLYKQRNFPGPPVPVQPTEITVLGGIRCTSALRTGWDLARQLAPERALAFLDLLLAGGLIRHGDLIDAARAAGPVPGIRQARELAAIADGRAAGPLESVLRLHWLGAQLPTPAVAWRVRGVRLALALPVHRFAVAVSGSVLPAEAAMLAYEGWTVIILDAQRLGRSDPTSTAAHLEREFRQHLLVQMTPVREQRQLR